MKYTKRRLHDFNAPGYPHHRGVRELGRAGVAA
jgi:hypothetical protein